MTSTGNASRLGLPPHVVACLFDLDGVLTDTPRLHAAAWAEVFDAVMRAHSDHTGQPFVPFRTDDYHRLVDGRPRVEGVRTFLAARGIAVAEGDPADPPTAETISGLANRKDAIFRRQLREQGVTAYPGSVAYLRAVRDAGLRLAVVSASAHCGEILAVAGIADLVEVQVDGLVARAEGLRGKPQPDTFLAAAHRLMAAPGEAAVFEDADVGVRAGASGNFAYVVGVDRVGRREALLAAGGNVVVSDLAELISEPRS
jgi:beta-phosphoglucomutase family hydrolase